MASKKGPKSTKNQTVEVPAKDTPETQETQAPETAPETQETEAPTQTPEVTEPTPEVVKDESPVKEEPTTELEGEESKDVLSVKLSAYIENMAPNKMVETDEIVRNQMRLRSIINLLLATPPESFNDAMKSVVKKVRAERKGAFSERLIFRGFPQIKIARSERQKLETMISLLLATADAKQPGKVKDVIDMNVVYRYVKNDEQQQKLQSYYGS